MSGQSGVSGLITGAALSSGVSVSVLLFVVRAVSVPGVSCMGMVSSSLLVCWQHASVSEGRIFIGSCARCHAEVEVELAITQSQYGTDRGPASPCTEPFLQAPGRAAIKKPVFKSLVCRPGGRLGWLGWLVA